MTDLFRAVQTAAAGSPYAVTATEKGFEVGLDIVDATWHSLYNQHHLRKTFVHYVSVDEVKKTYVIMDGSATVERTDLGHGRYAFQIAGKVEKFWGTQISVEKDIAVGIKDDPSRPLSVGEPGVLWNYTFSSEEGRALITGPAAQLGYAKKMDRFTKVGLIAGAIGASSIVIVPVALLIQHLNR